MGNHCFEYTRNTCPENVTPQNTCDYLNSIFSKILVMISYEGI